MKYSRLIVEKKEYEHLNQVLNILGENGNYETQKSLQRLRKKLSSVQIVCEQDMPIDVIRINSKIMVYDKNGYVKTIQLVLPSNNDGKQDELSILTPIGTALYAYAEGDSLDWESPSGKQQLKVVVVTQDVIKRKKVSPI